MMKIKIDDEEEDLMLKELMQKENTRNTQINCDRN